MPNENESSLRRLVRRRWRVIVAALLILSAAVWLLRRERGAAGEVATFAVRRGPLDIGVMVGGSLQALESQEVKCEVRVGYQGIKVLKIIEEGYLVTDEDIRTNKVLVELDSGDLQKQIVQQDIAYESALASLTDGQQAYDIQVNQNLSDIKAAEQKARFARMDFDKFLGDQVTPEIIDRVGIEKELYAALTNIQAELAALAALATNSPVSSNGTAPGLSLSNGLARPAVPAVPAEVASKEPTAEGSLLPQAVVDFTKYARVEALGDGEAKQKLRKAEDDLQVAQKEAGQSQAKLEGTRRLHAKGFVTKIELEGDELAAENSRLKVKTAQTARDLFIRYEFVKTAEETLSKYAEAARELVRARKAAISKLAQAAAKLKMAQGQFNIQSRQRTELYEQLDKCLIKATKPGLVVYGSGRDDMYWSGDERVREGATVRERQSLFTIPDMTRMSARVKIHETYIKLIKKGQKARITTDAFPDKVLEGEVSKVGVLPDSQNRWLNPDLKVYLTTISILSTNDWLKPGMSAKVEIQVDRLPNVIYVPMQAVVPVNGKHICYAGKPSRPERREVETGQFNDEFIEIKKGLKEGEIVLLRPLERPKDQKPEEQPGQPAGTKPAATPPPQPASVPSKGQA
jgi:HlyD family secretion protein